MNKEKIVWYAFLFLTWPILLIIFVVGMAILAVDRRFMGGAAKWQK